MNRRAALAALACATVSAPAAMAQDGLAKASGLEPRISAHAKANGVPEDLVHRVIRRESRYNPRAVGRGGAMGLMQIKHGTARALGYAGSPTGLLDAETNLTYGVRYLAGAYRVAGGNANRAVGYYASGYYYAAKRQGLAKTLVAGAAPAGEGDEETAAAPAETAAVQTASAEAAPSPYAAAELPDPARD